ncbi:MFS transporter [Anaerorudis cellulosivorans]|uniref:MFS transporter n=1 Tax=Anaerorudis cellulosivorans TaxID=3397862 RepID=UPI00221E715D|nr:MFS transporter [Seramator thermalis]MCW1736261.1 MFS transporter [Seramator thermalis]
MQIGLAYGAAAIAAIIFQVIVAMIADRFFSANRVLAFLNIVGAVLLFCLTTIEHLSLFFPILLAYTICFMPSMLLCNSISFENLADPSNEFSRIRLFGSIGWILTDVLISSFDLETFSTPFFLTSTMRHPKNFPKIFHQKETLLICVLGLSTLFLSLSRHF